MVEQQSIPIQQRLIQQVIHSDVDAGDQNISLKQFALCVFERVLLKLIDVLLLFDI